MLAAAFCPCRLHRKAARKLERERRKTLAQKREAAAKKKAKELEDKKWRAMQRALGVRIPPSDGEEEEGGEAKETDSFFGSSLLHGHLGSPAQDATGAPAGPGADAATVGGSSKADDATILAEVCCSKLLQ